MTVESKYQFTFYDEEKYGYEILDSAFKHLRLAQDSICEAAQKARYATSDMFGVAVFNPDGCTSGWKGDDETVATCAVSVASTLSSKSTTIMFVPSDDRSASSAKSGSGGAKTRLRALASIIDPKLSQKIKNRRGIWSGIFDEEENEGGVEIQLEKPGDLYEC